LALHKKYVDSPHEQQGRLEAVLHKLASMDIPDIKSPNKMESLRGRPAGRKNNPASSTRREPSRFELNDHGNRKKTCKTCHQVGHNSRTCNRRREGFADEPQQEGIEREASEPEAVESDSDQDLEFSSEHELLNQESDCASNSENDEAESDVISEPSPPRVRRSSRR
jgi:hypothetical protein